jgi:hypothetical protein
MTSAITATGLRKSFGGTSAGDLEIGTAARPARFRHSRRRATVIINQSRPVIAATGPRRLASAIERADGEDTGSEGASR